MKETNKSLVTAKYPKANSWYSKVDGYYYVYSEGVSKEGAFGKLLGWGRKAVHAWVKAAENL